jgi:hypothetical protein
MMPCRLNHNFICLGPRPLSKNLGTNLKLLTNRNVQFQWTLLLEPSSKVGINMVPRNQKMVESFKTNIPYNKFIFSCHLEF